MAQAKYTLYKYVKLSGGRWRYCRAALYKNHTIKSRREKQSTPAGRWDACF